MASSGIVYGTFPASVPLGAADLPMQGCFHEKSHSHAALRTGAVPSTASCRIFRNAYPRSKTQP